MSYTTTSMTQDFHQAWANWNPSHSCIAIPLNYKRNSLIKSLRDKHNIAITIEIPSANNSKATTKSLHISRQKSVNMRPSLMMEARRTSPSVVESLPSMLFTTMTFLAQKATEKRSTRMLCQEAAWWRSALTLEQRLQTSHSQGLIGTKVSWPFISKAKVRV